MCACLILFSFISIELSGFQTDYFLCFVCALHSFVCIRSCSRVWLKNAVSFEHNHNRSIGLPRATRIHMKRCWMSIVFQICRFRYDLSIYLFLVEIKKTTVRTTLCLHTHTQYRLSFRYIVSSILFWKSFFITTYSRSSRFSWETTKMSSTKQKAITTLTKRHSSRHLNCV